MNNKQPNSDHVQVQINLSSKAAASDAKPQASECQKPLPESSKTAALPRFKDNNNKRKYESTGKVFMRLCHCRCRTCPGCGPRYGKQVRWRLLEKEGMFHRPAMFTLTVDRSAFTSPKDAFMTITQKGYIRRLMRLLGVERWAWTLEFQMKTGDGWPHWHMVIDLPSGKLDLQRAWHLWRDKWHLGGLDLQRKAKKSVKHALCYVTKYLTKYPDKGFPNWVLHYDRRIRWVGASCRLGKLVSDREMIAKDVGNDEVAKKSLPRKHRSLAWRMADCDQIVNFFIETECDGELHQFFYGRLPLEQVIAATAKRSEFPILKDDDDKEYIQGNWEDFIELANEIMALANLYPRKCDHYWSSQQRFYLHRNAIDLTRKPDWNDLP